MLDQLVKKYGQSSTLLFDPTTLNANESLSKIIKLTFLCSFWFTMVPLGCYITFRAQGPINNEVSYMRLFQTYAYSMAVFIPLTALYILVLPFNRAKWILLLAAVAITTYY